MKETFLLLITILFFTACNSTNSGSNNDKHLKKDSANVISIKNNYLEDFSRDSIPPTNIGKLNSLSFKFNTDSSGYLLKSIVIYSNKNETQKIIANKEIERKEFQLIDWNFDGYKDISVLYNCGSGGCAYWIWNYSPKEKKYIYNKELSEVLGLEIDTLNKFIVFHYRAGFHEEVWDTMQYKNDKLKFVKGLYKEKWDDSLGNFWEKNTYSKMVENKLIRRIDSFISK